MQIDPMRKIRRAVECVCVCFLSAARAPSSEAAEEV